MAWISFRRLVQRISLTVIGELGIFWLALLLEIKFSFSKMDDPIPVVREVKFVYLPDAIDAQNTRWAQLIYRFKELYGEKPSFITRSPGRVNLVGEHIDYSLYDVLPMAIAADILVAVSTAPASSGGQEEAEVCLGNSDAKKYPSTTFSIPRSGEIPIDISSHSWANYFKAGVNGALKHIHNQTPNIPFSRLSILIDGTVPAGSGLSSSAALVCASALAILHATNPSSVSKRTLVDLAITAERAVGVNTGGMDQAASVLSRRNDALSVSFFPHLDARPVAFPLLDPPITFMIAQSLVAADKAVSAPKCYNLRVVECTLAAHTMAAALNLKLEPDASPLGYSLRGFQEAYFASPHAPTPLPSPKSQLEILLSLLPTLLPEQSGYPPSSIPPHLLRSVTTRFPVHAELFHLRRRAQHVFTEALRVLSFTAQLQSSPGPTLLPSLGALLDDSQASCRDVYECSCEELDALCAIAKKAGAHGARLTGAGWGGCVVCLVTGEKVRAVEEAWVKEYYAPRGIEERKLEEAIVVSKPGMGSAM